MKLDRKFLNIVAVISKLLFELRECYRFRWLVVSTVKSTLRMRYRRSFLGFAWSMIGPMLNYFILGLVLLRSDRVSSAMDLIPYILLGSVVFNFISVGINQGSQAIINNENYIKKIYLPKSIFALNTVSMEFINFGLQMIAVLVLLGLGGKLGFTLQALMLLPSILLLFAFTLGLAILGSVVTVYFRDLTHLIPIVMQASFFLTPIVYPLAQAPEWLRGLSRYNPFYFFVEIIRGPLSNKFVEPMFYVNAAGLAALCLMSGLLILKASDNRIVFLL